MRSVARLLLIALTTVTLSACSAQQFLRNAYEGIRSYNDSLRGTPLEVSKDPSVSYDQYRSELQRAHTAQTN
jgi:uncharacterized lipoprotein